MSCATHFWCAAALESTYTSWVIMQVASDHSQGEALLTIALLRDDSRMRHEAHRILETDVSGVMVPQARNATARRHSKSRPGLNRGLACA